jgi:hypothetical protein
MITKKAEENAAQIRPQIHDDEASANYFRAWRDVAAWNYGDWNYGDSLP